MAPPQATGVPCPEGPHYLFEDPEKGLVCVDRACPWQREGPYAQAREGGWIRTESELEVAV